MSAIIKLDVMLQEAVATPYRDLVTRPTGAAVSRNCATRPTMTPSATFRRSA